MQEGEVDRGLGDIFVRKDINLMFARTTVPISRLRCRGQSGTYALVKNSKIETILLAFLD